MKTLIFLDDERNLEDVSWIDYQQQFIAVLICRTAQDFMNTIRKFSNISDYTFSFDHDIQSYDQNGLELTGYDCAKLLCEYILEQQLNPIDLHVVVHSQNPIGRENIQSYIENFIRHCG